MSPTPLEVRPACTAADKKAFVELPWKIYRGDPNWVPPLLSMAYEIIDTEHHPFYEFARLALFNAWRGDELVGRVAAIDNPRHNETHEDKVGFFGFFECENDPETAQALLDAAGEWLRARGKDALRGPANPSVNAEYGLLVDGFDRPPAVMMTYNPPYYVDLIEGAGLEKAMDLWAWYAPLDRYGPQGENIPDKLKRVARIAQKRYGYTFHPVNIKDWDNEVAKIKQVYREAWAKNWGAVPLTDREFDLLAQELRQIADLDVTFLVQDRQGQVAGMTLSLTNLCDPLLKAYPRPGVPELWTTLKLLWHWKVRRHVQGIRVTLLGVLEPHRGKGVDALMIYESTMSAIRKGYTWGEMSWILETNDMMNRGIALMDAEVYKTYRIYQKPL